MKFGSMPLFVNHTQLHNRKQLTIHFCCVWYQAGDTRIPLPRKSLWTPQKIVDCKVGLCTSLRTVVKFL